MTTLPAWCTRVDSSLYSIGVKRTSAAPTVTWQRSRSTEVEPARPRYLLTEPGVGYRLTVE